jgi:hypothetical protein
MGGHTGFIVNHTKIAKTTACRNRVALMFTAILSSGKLKK